jgi:hypothetical protein
VEAAARCECEGFDERPRLTEPPGAIVDLDASNANREAPEHVDRDV